MTILPKAIYRVNAISQFSQFSSVAQSCPTLCDPMNCSTPGLPVHHQLPEFTQTHIHRVGDAIQPSHPLSSSSCPVPNPSQHQSLFHESTLPMRWPKYWGFSFSIIPSKEIPGLISFRMETNIKGTYIIEKYKRRKKSYKINPKQLRKWQYECVYQ